MRYESATARAVLTRTGGFLASDPDGGGYTHTFNPAIGCGFAAGLCGRFCYAREFAERLGGRGTWGERVLVKERAPELLRRELERAAARPADHPLHVARLRVFSSSTTDPCAGPVLASYREALRVVADFPVARWVVQTRSPGVVALADELRALGDRAVVSLTIETDDGALWDAGPPGAPSIAARRRAAEELAALGLRLHLAVAPCLRPADPVAFADWIATVAGDATVDGFVSGDGSGGRRTAASPIGAFLEERGIDWRDERPARELHRLLDERMGERAGWSASGFARIAR